MALDYKTEEELREIAVKMLRELPAEAVKDFLHRHVQGEWVGPLSYGGPDEPGFGKYFFSPSNNPRLWSIGGFAGNMKKPELDKLDLPPEVKDQLEEMEHRLDSLKQRSNGFGLNFDEQLGELRGMHHVLSEIVGLRKTHFWLYQWWQASLY